MEETATAARATQREKERERERERREREERERERREREDYTRRDETRRDRMAPSSLSLCWEGSQNQLKKILGEFWSNVRPGGRLHPAWFFEAKGHLLVELLLFAVILFLLTRKSFKPSKQKPLTKKEQEELIEEWLPEPLVPEVYAGQAPENGRLRNRRNKTKLQQRYAPAPVVKGKACTPFVQIGNKKVMNLVSTNFLNLASSERIEASCERALNKYGCGSCGPRGFYGTIDVHLELEKRVASFLGTEEAILYSYDISTPASAIPAFCKSGDLIVADAGISYAIQSGLTLSRSTVKYFEHNNLKDLVAVLDAVEEESKKGGKKGVGKFERRFVVVEGLYANYGDLAPLPDIVKLKDKYQFRLIVDESFALGVLGAGGRGSVEHFGLSRGVVDITLASLGNAIGSVGGICAGSRRVCDHQRLSGAGYVFSASLPPYLAVAAIEAIDILEEEGKELAKGLASKVLTFRQYLEAQVGSDVDLGGHPSAPIIHLYIRTQQQEMSDVEYVDLLQKVVDGALKEGVFLTLAKYSFLDKYPGKPSIRMAINVDHTEEELRKAAKVITQQINKI